jgi:hypothetical protein
MFGGSLSRVNSPPNQLMSPCFREQLCLSQPREYGRLAPLASADSLYGWWNIIGAGLRTS